MGKTIAIACGAALALSSTGCVGLQRWVGFGDEATLPAATTRRGIDDSLAAFEAEPRVDCASEKLLAAAAAAVRADKAQGRSGVEPESRRLSGLLVLRVADTARANGCGGLARDLYAYLVETSRGANGSAVRQRAEAGLAGP